MPAVEKDIIEVYENVRFDEWRDKPEKEIRDGCTDNEVDHELNEFWVTGWSRSLGLIE
jgi:hypothetical protein